MDGSVASERAEQQPERAEEQPERSGEPDLDEALRLAKRNDPRGMAALYEALSGSLLAYLRVQVRIPEDAEDVLGQVFYEAIRDLDRFSGDASGFRVWLFRIAHHRAVDLGRKLTRRGEAPLTDAEDREAPDDPEREAIARLERARLWDAVRLLPEEQRKIITLRLAGGLSAGEIATIVGKRTGAVKALQHRALQNLARALGARRVPPPP